jgi:hypothetical protein
MEAQSIKGMNEGNNEKERTKLKIKKHYFVSCSPKLSPVVENSFFKLIPMFFRVTDYHKARIFSET